MKRKPVSGCSRARGYTDYSRQSGDDPFKHSVPRPGRHNRHAPLFRFLLEPLIVKPAHTCTFDLWPAIWLAKKIVPEKLLFLRFVQKYAANTGAAWKRGVPRPFREGGKEKVAFEHNRRLRLQMI